MKRCILLLVLIGFFSGSVIWFYLEIEKINSENEKLFKEFKKNELVGVDGKVSLKGVKKKKDELFNEVKSMIELDNLNIEEVNKQIENKKNENSNLKQEISDLSSQINQLDAKKKELSNQYSVLNSKYNKLKNMINSNSTSIQIGNGVFPLINQYPNYPTGCESVALTMLLRYYGVNVTPNDVINRLNKESYPYFENGIKYGGNPEVGFIGNPYSYNAYGVFEKPIADVANYYKSGIQIRNNFPFQEVLNLVQKKIPVMVWTSMNLAVPYISNTWIYKPTMEKISWKSNEHVVILVGYSGDNVVVADPIGGKLKNFSKSVFESRYNYYGRRALYYL